LCFADPLIFPVLEYAQKLGLKVQRKLADFVQKQGAVGSVFEIARFGGVGARESPFGVAEQGRFDQARRDGGAIERVERFAVAPCVMVQATAGDDFLAATGFAFYQYGER
jgi:hypothetical protein